jgi:hypothetical protein
MLDERLSGSFPLDGRQVPFVLGMPSVGRSLVRVYDPIARPTSQMSFPLGTMLYADLASVDGGVMKRDMLERIVDSVEALSAILHKRNDFYEWARQEGRLFARCPHCRERAPDWSIKGLSIPLRHAAPDLFRPDGVFLAVPALARPCSPGKRPGGVPTAAELRFELPSHRLGLGHGDRARGGTFAPIDIARERAQWEAWLPPGIDDAVGRSWWRKDDLGFRTILRVASAIESLDRGGPPTPVTLVDWPAIDLLFVSSLGVLTHFVDVPPGSTLIYTCPCGGRFLPLG